MRIIGLLTFGSRNGASEEMTGKEDRDPPFDWSLARSLVSHLSNASAPVKHSEAGLQTICMFLWPKRLK